MTPAALETYRDLRSLGLPAGVLRKIAIATDGKPNLSRLSDDEFTISRGRSAVCTPWPILHKEYG